MNTDSQWSKQNVCLLFFHVRIRCGSLSITHTSVTSGEYNVLHGQVSLVAVSHIYVFREVMKGCKNLKIH